MIEHIERVADIGAAVIIGKWLNGGEMPSTTNQNKIWESLKTFIPRKTEPVIVAAKEKLVKSTTSAQASALRRKERAAKAKADIETEAEKKEAFDKMMQDFRNRGKIT